MFKDKLFECRKKAGLSQEELANHLGVSRQSVSKWENGSSFPEMDKCVECCKLFNISLDELFLDESNKTIDENVYDNVVKAINKNNRRQWIVMGFTLIIIGIIAVISVTQTTDSYTKLKYFQNLYNDLNSKYDILVDQLDTIKNNLVSEEESLRLDIKNLKYLNSKEASVLLETRLNEEHVNNQVQVVIEYENHKETFDLSKDELIYKADVILPIERIEKATLMVKNGNDITYYPLIVFQDNNGMENKESLQSLWKLENVQMKKDHLIFNIITTTYLEEKPIEKVEYIEIEDKNGKIVYKIAMPKQNYYSLDVDMNIHEKEGHWKVYFLYEKDGLNIREYQGKFFQIQDRGITWKKFDFGFNKKRDSSEIGDIQIIDK